MKCINISGRQLIFLELKSKSCFLFFSLYVGFVKWMVGLMSKTLSTTWSKMLRSISMLPTKERLFLNLTIICTQLFAPVC